MKKLLLILLIKFIAIVNITKAQTDIDTFKVKLERFKKYQIADNLIGKKWINSIVGFNDKCDTISFQDKHYDLSGFRSAFNRFITDKFKDDTIVLLLDYGDNIFLNKILCSYEILANNLEKYRDNGIYFFSTFQPTKKRIFIKADTIDLYNNNVIIYNGNPLKISDLSNHLQISKPDLVILNVDSDLPIKDLTEIIELTEKLTIKTIFVQK